MDRDVKAHQLELLEILNAYDDMPEPVESGLLAAIKWLARREPKATRIRAVPQFNHIPRMRLPFVDGV